jgi:c-di-GMP phosphodiesterase
MQGYALQRPSLESGCVIAAIDPTRLQQAAGIVGQALDFDEIEHLLRSEPGLTYHVLQLASLGRLGETRRKINTVREALIQAGTWRIQSWIALLLLRPTGPIAHDAVISALTTARACELLAPTIGQPARTGFTAGMVSTFGQLLHLPSDELTRSLPLSDDLRRDAFTSHTPLGRVVCDVADRQAGTIFPRMLSGLTPSALDTALATGFQWALEASAALGPAPDSRADSPALTSPVVSPAPAGSR